MLRPLVPLLGGALLLLAACAPVPPPADPSPAPAPGRDVVLDGVSLLGAWDAVGAPDQPDIDADLRNGILSRSLIFNPGHRVTLAGVDRRAGGQRVTYEGRLEGREVTFEGLPGRARLEVRRDGTLVLTDPGGNRTVYRRSR